MEWVTVHTGTFLGQGVGRFARSDGHVLRLSPGDFCWCLHVRRRWGETREGLFWRLFYVLQGVPCPKV